MFCSYFHPDIYHNEGLLLNRAQIWIQNKNIDLRETYIHTDEMIGVFGGIMIQWSLTTFSQLWAITTSITGYKISFHILRYVVFVHKIYCRSFGNFQFVKTLEVLLYHSLIVNLRLNKTTWIWKIRGINFDLS